MNKKTTKKTSSLSTNETVLVHKLIELIQEDKKDSYFFSPSEIQTYIEESDKEDFIENNIDSYIKANAGISLDYLSILEKELSQKWERSKKDKKKDNFKILLDEVNSNKYFNVKIVDDILYCKKK